MRWRWMAHVVISLGTATLGALGLVLSSPASVYANCNPAYPTSKYATSSDNPTDRPTGAWGSIDAEYVQPHILSGYYLGGVYADVTDYQNPYLDPYQNDATSTWVMEQIPGDAYSFVQVGYIHGYSNGVEFYDLFAEWDSSSMGNHMVLASAPAQGGTYWLTITNGSTGWYNFFYNTGSGNKLIDTVDMGSTFVSEATQADLASEVHSKDSQMPGGYTDSTVFQSANVYYNGAWQNFGVGTLNNYYSPFFNAAIISSTEFAENDTSCWS